MVYLKLEYYVEGVWTLRNRMGITRNRGYRGLLMRCGTQGGTRVEFGWTWTKPEHVIDLLETQVAPIPPTVKAKAFPSPLDPPTTWPCCLPRLPHSLPPPPTVSGTPVTPDLFLGGRPASGPLYLLSLHSGIHSNPHASLPHIIQVFTQMPAYQRGLSYHLPYHNL
jgi:hypothetical protein